MTAVINAYNDTHATFMKRHYVVLLEIDQILIISDNNHKNKK